MSTLLAGGGRIKRTPVMSVQVSFKYIHTVCEKALIFLHIHTQPPHTPTHIATKSAFHPHMANPSTVIMSHRRDGRFSFPTTIYHSPQLVDRTHCTSQEYIASMQLGQF